MIIKHDIRNHYTLAAEMLAVQRLAYQVESKLIDYPNLPPLFESIADIQSSSEQFFLFVERSQSALYEITNGTQMPTDFLLRRVSSQ